MKEVQVIGDMTALILNRYAFDVNGADIWDRVLVDYSELLDIMIKFELLHDYALVCDDSINGEMSNVLNVDCALQFYEKGPFYYYRNVLSPSI